MSSFTERITVNEQQISFQDVVRIVNVIKPLVEQMARDPNLRHPTFFEVVTAMAFKYFAEKRVEFAVIEAGMGGKLDATNVVHSLISVITNVGLEHTEVLGDTVLEIAEKKAGIIKEGGVLITATENEVFNLLEKVCKSVGSKIIRVGKDIKFNKLQSNLEGQRFQLDSVMNKFDELFIPLLGDYQLTNTATAVGAVQALQYHGVKVSKEAIENGLKNVNWPGRLEIMHRHPLLVLDCAKDPEAARAVIDTVPNIFDYERLIAIISISSDKNISDMIKHLAKVTDLFIITSHNMVERAADPSHLAKEVQKHAKAYEIVNGVKDAIKRALEQACENDMVLVVGSVFLVGEVRKIWCASQCERKRN
jgi:dihydrofolate synthase/folylpolyglutamate synthase